MSVLFKVRSKAYVAFMLGFLSLSGSGAFAGSETGNGGDPVEMQFALRGKEALRLISARPWSFSEVDPSRLRAAIEQTKVVASTRILKDRYGQEKTALNQPEKQIIIVNREAWRELSDREQTALALHEYLGIIGIERDSYGISMELYELTPGASEDDENLPIERLPYGTVLTVLRDIRFFSEKHAGVEPPKTRSDYFVDGALRQDKDVFLFPRAESLVTGCWFKTLSAVDEGILEAGSVFRVNTIFPENPAYWQMGFHDPYSVRFQQARFELNCSAHKTEVSTPPSFGTRTYHDVKTITLRMLRQSLRGWVEVRLPPKAPVKRFRPR